MSFSIVHLADPHFGPAADLQKVAAVEALIPDLAPDLVVVSGDLTHRARHGEFQAARVWMGELERTAPVYVVPGEHDTQWWRRPFVPWKPRAKYERYARYFGPVLAPTQRFAEVVITGIPTAHGLAWRSLTPRFKELGEVGHIDRADIDRVTATFKEAKPDQLRVIVMHHNLLRGERSDRMGLSRWPRVHKWIIETGVDLVLTGHDHLAKADVMGGVIVSQAGTLSTLATPDRPVTFHRIVVEEASLQIQLYEWQADRRVFHRSDVLAFARARVKHTERVPAGIV